MREGRFVSIDSASDVPVRRTAADAVVLVDVLCDTTTLVTAAAHEGEVRAVRAQHHAVEIAVADRPRDGLQERVAEHTADVRRRERHVPKRA